MVDQDERLKIVDFGIARIAESNLTRIGFQRTQLEMQIGTPGYMSPEQIQGDEIDHRADIFAVGAMCYELLSYREAFPGSDTREIERNVMQAQPVPLASLIPGIDPQIDTIVSRALAKDRNERYQDAQTLGKAFERCRLRLGPSSAPPPPRRSMPPEQEYFAHLAAGRFMLQRSVSTGGYVFYPRVAEPGTGATDLEWVEASGRASIEQLETLLAAQAGQP